MLPCPSREYNNDWFCENQEMLLGVANSDYGRDLFLIDRDLPEVTQMTRSSYTVDMGGGSSRSEFHSGAKYASLIRTYEDYLWEYVEWLKSTQANPYAYGQPYLGLRVAAAAAQCTFLPDPEAACPQQSVDGYLQRFSSGSTVAQLRDGAGTGVCLVGTSIPNILFACCCCSACNYAIARWVGMVFETCALPDCNTIDAAVLQLRLQGKCNGLSGQCSCNSKLVVMKHSSASASTLVNADYQTLCTCTDYGRSITQASWAANTDCCITLNAAGRGNISTTAVSKFGTAQVWLRCGTAAGLTWSAGAQQVLEIYGADQTGTGCDPALIVCHSCGGVTTRRYSLPLLGVG